LDVVRKWGDLVEEQRRELEGLGVPYFGDDEKERENREKMLVFLDDLVPLDQGNGMA